MGIVVLGAVFVDIKGYPTSTYIPGGRNAGPGGAGPRRRQPQSWWRTSPTWSCGPPLSAWWTTPAPGADVIRKLQDHKVNTDYILRRA